MAKWLPPNGFACQSITDAKVGGTFRMRFATSPLASHSFGGNYVELVPSERLRYTDKLTTRTCRVKCR
jgi:uncharacterized protein YndB with AHSA1/START domain